MSRNARTLCAALAVGLGMFGSQAASPAKPPDLPADPSVVCPDGSEAYPITSADDPALLPERIRQAEALLPESGPRVFEALWEAIRQPWVEAAAMRPRGIQPGRGSSDRADRQVQEAGQVRRSLRVPTDGPRYRDEKVARAEVMFLLGERCLARGDVRQAVRYYQEAHLLSPASAFGRQAMQRVLDVEAGRTVRQDLGGAEEAEEGLDAFTTEELRRHREMLRQTVPLGGVPMPNDH